MARTGVSAERLAVDLGVPERLVRKWRSERDVNPSWLNVKKLADHFGRTPDWFYVEAHDGEGTG